MKFRTLLLATTIATVATGYAYAQTSTYDSSKPQAGVQTMQPDQTSKKKMMKKDEMMNRGTTGAGAMEPSTPHSTSPASQDEKVKKTK